MTPAPSIPKENKSRHRVVWVDFLRVFIMLWIICAHGQYTDGGWQYIGRLFCGPTVMLFFLFAGILVKRPGTAWKRGLGLLGVYIFWTLLLTYAVFPMDRFICACIRLEEAVFGMPDLTWATMGGQLQPDLRELMPPYGPMWFLRALALYTLATPLLVCVPRRLLFAGAILLEAWGMQLAAWAGDWHSSPFLPFFLNHQLGAKSLAFFMIGLAIMKSGGIHHLTGCLASLHPAVLILPFLVSGTLALAAHAGCFPTAYLVDGRGYVPFDLMGAACLLALGGVIHRILQRAGKAVPCAINAVAALAPCVFTVYMLHWFFMDIEKSIWHVLVEPHRDISLLYHVLNFLRPVLVFLMAWLAFLLMRRVPHCSRLLCFVSKPESGNKRGLTPPSGR